MKKNLKGAITISRPTYGSGKKAIIIRVDDKASRTNFLEVELSLQGFAEAITGLGHTDCELTVKGLHNLGKIMEHKKQVVEFPIGYSDKNNIPEEVWVAALHPYEIDGWVCTRYVGSKDTIVQYGDKVKPMILNLSFRRYVEV